MWLKRVWGYLLPGGAERDEDFRRHIDGLSRQGLYIIAGVELVSPLFLLAAQYLVMSREGTVWHRACQTAAVMAVGVLTLLAARAESIRFPPRLAAAHDGEPGPGPGRSGHRAPGQRRPESPARRRVTRQTGWENVGKSIGWGGATVFLGRR